MKTIKRNLENPLLFVHLFQWCSYKSYFFLLFVIPLLIFSACNQDQVEMEMDNNVVIAETCPFGQYNGIVVSYQNSRQEVDALNAKVIHSWLQWDLVEPQLKAPFITKDNVTEEMITNYASGQLEGIDWSILDQHVNEYQGLKLVMGIGSGWKNSMPFFDGIKITPDRIGRDQYIGQLYLHTRACVRRYKDRVDGWQIENEPNISQELIALGLREGNAWTDNAFMTQVLETLEKAVRMEAPQSWVTINFFVDVNGFENDIARWSHLTDVVGIDSYQDFFTTDPIVAADSLLSKIEYISTLSKDRPVIVMETGFASGPSQNGFTEDKQQRYIQEIYSRMNDHKSCGILYFKHTTTETTEATVFPFRNFRGLINDNGAQKLSWHFLKEFFKE